MGIPLAPGPAAVQHDERRPVAHLDDVDVPLANPNGSAAARLNGLDESIALLPLSGTHDRPDAVYMTATVIMTQVSF